MAEIVVTEFMDQAALDRLSGRCRVLYDPGLADGLATHIDDSRALPPDLVTHVEDCRALIVRNRTRVGPALLEAAPALTCIGRLGVGLDNIDTEACAARGVAVYPATGANDRSVAEYVIAMVLVLLRGAFGATADVAAGAWPRQRLIGREASGRTLGLVGFGAIAHGVASRARALGMDVLATDPYLAPNAPAWQLAERADLDDLLRRSDAISVHVPLTAETRGMIGADALGTMRQGAVLINTARGGVVDEVALAGALRGGPLAGAALDVFETEPLTPEAGNLFRDLPNVILTPHIAGLTTESNVRVSDLIADKVLAHLAR